MLRRSLLVGALTTGTLIAGPMAVAASAAPNNPLPATASATSYPADSLRALASKVGLRVGTAVNPDLLGTNARYTEITADQFSSVTPENVMKWEAVEPAQGTYNWAPADKLVAFAKDNKQLVRGHNLVWHSQLPKWLTPDGFHTTFTPDQLKAILKKHIQDEVTHFRGDIWQWDVVNEAFNENGTPRQDIWYQAWGGTGYIADAFRWAHAADPKALLFYNDYNIESTNAKSNAEYAFIKDLKAQGVPVDGVGFQTHLDTKYGFPDLQNNLQRFADLGLKVAETEVDIRTNTTPGAVNTPIDAASEDKQNTYWDKTLQACLAVRSCISYTAWGFGDAYSWVPGVFRGEGAALIYDEALQPKQSYYTLQQDLANTDAAHRTGIGAGQE